MERESVKDLIASLRDTDIAELRIEKKNFKLFLRKDEQVCASKVVDTNEAALAVREEETREEPPKMEEIKSTMVGTFHACVSNRPPLVIEGDHVMPGQKIGIIEAMKVMKDVISTIQGKVVKVLITDGHAVEYGQPLFKVDTNNKHKKETGN